MTDQDLAAAAGGPPAEPPPGSRLLIAARGNIEVAMPITPEAVAQEPVANITASIVTQIILLQHSAPGYATNPIPVDGDDWIMLQVEGRDAPMLPHLPLLGQTEGRWETLPDTERFRLAQAIRPEAIGLPACRFLVVEQERPRIHLPIRRTA